MKKVDLKKVLKDLYAPSAGVKEVVVDTGCFLSVDGVGAPGGEAYAAAVEALNGVAFTVKSILKEEGVVDFVVGKLECQWEVEDPLSTPMDQWRWRLLIRVPEEVSSERVKVAARIVTDNKGFDAQVVKRKRLKEGRCLQLTHVGPFDEVSRSYSILVDHAGENGFALAGPPHEIYLSDPRRTAPAKLKTILRFPVKKKR